MSTEIVVPNVPQGLSSFGKWFPQVFRLWSAQWSIWALQSLILLVLPAVGVGLFLILRSTFAAAFLLALCALSFALFMPGMVLTALKQMRNQSTAVGDILLGVNYFGGALLILLVMYMGILACVIGSIVTVGLFWIALPALVDRNLSVGDAIRFSWKTTTQNALLFILFSWLMANLSTVGSSLCYAGMLASLPWFPIAMAVAYEQTVNGEPAEYSTHSTETTSGGG